MEIDWSPDGSLILCTGKNLSQSASSDQIQHEIRTPETHYRNDTFKKLLSESHGVFHQLQQETALSTRVSPEYLLHTSQKYRSILRMATVELQEALLQNNVNGETEALLDICKCAEIVWTLVEMLFLKPQDSVLPLNLVDWGRWNFTEVDVWAAELCTRLRQDPVCLSDTEIDQQFWHTVLLLTLLGRLDATNQLLGLHPRNGEGAFTSIQELLRKAPLKSLGSESEDWTFWRKEGERRLEFGHFQSFPELETLAKILTGDEEAIVTLSRQLLSGWFEMIIPAVLFRRPDSKLFELQDIAEWCRGIMEAENGWRPIDEMLLALFELDLLRGLKEMSAASADWWLPAHLADLLFHAGCVDVATKTHDRLIPAGPIKDASASLNIREYLLLDFAASLMRESGLWQLSVEYFEACPTFGRRMLELNLDRIPISSDHKALKLMRICEEHGLTDAGKSICRQRATSALGQNQLSVALGWCLQAKDASLASAVAERCLSDYSRTGLLCGIQLLDAVSESTLLSPSLIFLGKYREYHRLRSSDLKAAASLLVELLDSRAAPRPFWLILLDDIANLLQLKCDQPLFSKGQLYILIRVLQTMDVEINVLKSKVFNRSEDIEKVHSLRVLLMQNLSNALASE